MQAVTARHDDLVGEIVATRGGEAVRARSEGDSAFAVFASPSAAVAAAVDLQRRLASETWPASVAVAVRMAVHTGPPPPRAGEHYGPVVNRCARLRGLAHGGQVLVSGITAALVESDLPPGIDLLDLGRHRLKDLAEPEHVFQVTAPGLEHTFPPVRSVDAARHNLPSAGRLVGRAHDLSEVRRLLAHDPLVTITGMGGVGKTRLALEVAGRELEASADGVWWVQLADLHDAEGVDRAVAAAVGVRPQPGRPLGETIVERLQDRSTLLVLDNAEHLLEPVADLVEAILRAGPGVRALVTSRRPLGLPGEVVWALGPMAVPSDTALAPDALLQHDAVQLFVNRAAAVLQGFLLDASTAAGVATICRRVEGIPLAIEMAAAQVADHGLAAIVAGLEHRLSMAVPVGGDDERHRTLRATIDWSHSLLGRSDQVLLRRLAVFSGFNLEAAEAVCAGDPVHEAEVLDVLVRLVDSSLVVADDRPGDARYRLLEMVRDYATEQLADSGEGEALRQRHLEWCRMTAGTQDQHRAAPPHELVAVLDRLDDEHDNLRAALRWAISTRRPDAADLARRLSFFWEARGHWREAVGFLVAASAVPTGDWAAQLEALTDAGVLSERTGDREQARRMQEQALALAAGHVDEEGAAGRDARRIAAHALTWLGEHDRVAGDVEGARRRHLEALALRRRDGRGAGTAQTLAALGSVEWQAGDLGRARTCYEESLSLFEAVGHRLGAAALNANLGTLAGVLGDVEEALRRHEASLEVRREVGDIPGVLSSVAALAELELDRGDDVSAAARVEDVLEEARQVGSPQTVSLLLAIRARAHLRAGDTASAQPAVNEALALALPPDLPRMLTAWAEDAGRGGCHRAVLVLAGAAEALGGELPGSLVQRAEEVLGDGAAEARAAGRQASETGGALVLHAP